MSSDINSSLALLQFRVFEDLLMSYESSFESACVNTQTIDAENTSAASIYPAKNNAKNWPHHDQTAISGDETVDHFIVKNGVEYAGTHLILDLWEASKLDDLTLMENTMREAVSVAGATLLHIHLHHFTPNGGISGVAVLAESHISVHTWPERGFAAFDIFMCGDAQPELAIPVLRKAFNPENVNVSEHLRGANLIEEQPNNNRPQQKETTTKSVAT